MFCREQVARLGDRRDEIEAGGVKMVAIGNGTAQMAQDFKEKFGVEFDLFTDPSRRSYEAAGWRRPTVGAVLGLGSVIKNSVRAKKGGFKQENVQGDAFQLGGILVVEPSGEVLFEHTEEAAGNHADPDAIVAALRQRAG